MSLHQFVLLADQFLDALLLIVLLYPDIGDLELHEHRLTLVLSFNLEAFLLLQLMQSDNVTLTLKNEVSHNRVLAKPANLQLGV